MTNCALRYDDGVFNNNELYSFDPATKTYILIATMDQKTGAIKLVKDEPIAFEEAKLVLNAYGYETQHTNVYKELRAWVGVVADNGCNVAMYTYPKQTDDNLNTFLVSWQRPINTDADPIQPKLDANTNENYIHLIDYLKLYDWRGPKSLGFQGYMYADDDDLTYDGDHYWFWTYYRLKSIILDLNPQYAWSNLHYGTDYRPISAISGQVDLWAFSDAFGTAKKNKGLSVYNFDKIYPYFNKQSREDQLQAFMGLPDFDNPGTKYDAKKQRFGTIYYQNNAENVTEFDVYIPYTIEYEWGWISRIANFHIDSTHGNH
jgi:hypothetical protein